MAKTGEKSPSTSITFTTFPPPLRLTSKIFHPQHLLRPISIEATSMSEKNPTTTTVRSPVFPKSRIVNPTNNNEDQTDDGRISAKNHTWLLCRRHTQLFFGPASVVCPDITPIAPGTASAPDAPGAAVALPCDLQHGSQGAAKEALDIKGIQKRMAKLERDIQLAKICFGMKGDAQDGGISSQDARLLGFFCWMLTHPAEKGEKVWIHRLGVSVFPPSLSSFQWYEQITPTLKLHKKLIDLILRRYSP
ncbi:hypothetical protein BZA77DRAFT_390116 [Pyronema omphalodes]|nr:hypothetical protein BZA77DRAFT_390116 [Pyronema omphalodes]